MKPVYEAENALDANLAKGTLNQTGIHAVIKGEICTGKTSIVIRMASLMAFITLIVTAS